MFRAQYQEEHPHFSEARTDRAVQDWRQQKESIMAKKARPINRVDTRLWVGFQKAGWPAYEPEVAQELEKMSEGPCVSVRCAV